MPVLYSRFFAYLLALVMLVAGLAMVELVVRQTGNELRSEEESRIYGELSSLRADLEAEINSTLHLSRGLVAYVATHPDIDRADFDRFAQEIVSGNPRIRNIGLAPGNVIRHIFPLQGNERAIGIDYSTLSAQWEAVSRAIELRSSVVAGPLKLVQGGRAVISRTPIFLAGTDDGEGSRIYWGLASIVIDVDSLFDTVIAKVASSDMDLALRGKDGMGAEGDLIFGQASLFDAGAVTLPVTLPNGSWELAGYPSGGWSAIEAGAGHMRLAGYSLTILVTGFAFLLVTLLRRNRDMALYDQLTGLANRRLVLDTMHHLARAGDGARGAYTIFYTDLDGFKPINDRFGHANGDLVLAETAARLRACTRATDTVARMGGDEFIVIVPGVLDTTRIDAMCEKLRAAIEAPMDLGGTRLHVGSSVGWARCPEDGGNVEELLVRADQRMYSVKRRSASAA